MTKQVPERCRTRWVSVVAALLVGLGTVGVVPDASAAAAPDSFMQQRIRLFDLLTSSDLCLHAEVLEGSPVRGELCTARQSKQAWRVTRVADPSGRGDVTVTLKNIDHGKCVRANPASMDTYLAGRSNTFQIDVGPCVAGDRRQMWDLRGPTAGTHFEVRDVPIGLHGHYLLHANLAENLEGFVETVEQVNGPDGRRPAEPTGLLGTRSDILGPWAFDSPSFMCAVGNRGTSTVFISQQGDIERYRCA